MSSQLQRLVDSLGDRLNRSVAIDDRNLRLLAYNAYAGTVDDLRMRVIMQRESPRGLAEYVQDLCPLDEGDPFRVPQRPEFGLTIERIVMPIRHASALLGFVWLLASDGPLTDDQTFVLRQAAEHAAHILRRDHLLDGLRQGRIREHLCDLLSDDPRLQRDAARQLIEEEVLVAGPVSSLVVVLPHEPDQPFSDKDRLALAIGLDHGCGRTPPRSAIHLERIDHGVVVAARSGLPADREIDDLAATVQQRVCQASGYRPEQCYVGIGESRPSLSEVHGSYLEARRAANVARVTRTFGTVVRYSHLSVYGLLAELPPDRLRHSLHPGLRRLLEHDGDSATLIGTLETFLNNAGDVKRTAEELNLHRASVHYRLRRIEDIAHIDLSNGDDRLALHVSLKVARLVEIRLRRSASHHRAGRVRAGRVRAALAIEPCCGDGSLAVSLLVFLLCRFVFFRLPGGAAPQRGRVGTIRGPLRAQPARPHVAPKLTCQRALPRQLPAHQVSGGLKSGGGRSCGGGPGLVRRRSAPPRCGPRCVQAGAGPRCGP